MGTRTLGRLSPWVALVGVAALVSCATPSSRGRWNDGASRLFDEGMARYNEGDVRGAIPVLEEAAGAGAGGELRADIEFQLGRCYLETGELAPARVHLEEAARYSNRPLTLFRVHRARGDAYYRSHDFLSAAGAYREALEHESDPLFLAEIYYRLAVSLRATGDERDADRYRTLAGSYEPPPGEPRYEEVAALAGPREIPVAPFGRFLPGVAGRSDWGARPLLPNHDAMTRIYRVTIHHSAIVSSALNPREVAREIRDIQRMHQEGRHWADIGYHYVVDRGGRIWEGRSLDIQGAHAGNRDLNRGNVGVVLLGDFNVQRVSSDQEHALETLLLYLGERFGIEAGEIHTHGELKNTECPGRDLQRVVDRVRHEFRRLEPLRMAERKAEIRHYVRRGETLFGIARRYGVSVTDLREANEALQSDRVLTGQELRIPPSR